MMTYQGLLRGKASKSAVQKPFSFGEISCQHLHETIRKSRLKDTPGNGWKRYTFKAQVGPLPQLFIAIYLKGP